jgi:hypothetical protein
VLACALRHREGVEHVAHHPRDADRLARLGHHPDDAVAGAHFRADAAFGVAAAGDQFEAVGTVGDEQDHRVAEAEQLFQLLEDAVEQAVDGGSLLDAVRQRLQRRHREGHRFGLRRGAARGHHFRHQAHLVGERLDRLHLVDVGAQQLEDALQAGVRGDGLDAQPHALERGAFQFGAHVAQAQGVDLQRVGIVEAHQRLRVLGDVAAALVEELERQRHVPAVHVVDVAEHRHVGHAVLRTRAQPRRQQALEAGRECLERDHNGSPAPGPGVCS